MNRSEYIINIVGQTKVDQLVALEKKYNETQSPEVYAEYQKLSQWAMDLVAAEDRARGR